MGNRKQVFLTSHTSKAPMAIQLTTRVCVNNSFKQEQEPRGSPSERRWRADVSVPGVVGKDTPPPTSADCFTGSHLRMCPGMERLLRPRWFTAWTIILPVQLTRP